MWLTIIIGLVALSVIALVHELGHFVTAKAAGVKVLEFGLGFPPRLVGKRLGQTIYSLNAIPFGGFNKLAGEEDPSAPGSLAGKGRGARLLVLSAGSLMNILLAFLLFSVIFMIPHDVVMGQALVKDVAPNSPAARAGIEPGDIVLSVNDKPVNNSGDLGRYIHLNLGEEIDLLVQHSDSSREHLQATPRWQPPEGEGAIGILMTTANPEVVSQSYPFWKAIPMGVSRFIETFILYKNGIIGMILGTFPAQLIGPVGVVQVTGEVAVKAGMASFLEFAALISLVIGIFNLFPLPALDGGRISFVFLEWIRRGKRVSPRIEGLIHSIGFAMLMAVIVLITYQDILRIIRGESILP